MKHIKLFEEFIGEAKKQKQKKPNEVTEIDIDFVGGDNDLEKMRVEYDLIAKTPKRGSGQVILKGKKKDLLNYLQSPEYGMDAQDIEDLFPELLEGVVNEKKLPQDSREFAKKMGTQWDIYNRTPDSFILMKKPFGYTILYDLNAGKYGEYTVIDKNGKEVYKGGSSWEMEKSLKK